MRPLSIPARFVLVCALAAVLAVPGAALPVSTALPAAAADSSIAHDRASEAAAEVDALLDSYDRAEAVEAKGVKALAEAVAAQQAAEVSTDDSAARASAARALQADRVRGLYAQGGTAGLLDTVLAANSADDLFWRISTVDRITGTVLADSRSQVQQAAAAATLASARQEQAEAAARAQAVALQGLQSRTGDAAGALTAAKQTLAALDAKARKAAASAAAARRIAAAEAAAGSARSAAAGPMTALSIPAEFQTAYQAAAKTCPGMDWTLLAGVGQVESGHGRNDGPSSAGAIGPMQFLPATFAGYAVDGDRDGVKDAWDPEDAIFTAARYLCESGAEGGSTAGIHRAILAYNHAEWYVDLVLSAQAAIRARIG